MFNNKRRIQSAWARGLMFGRAAGARDERERIIALLEAWLADDDGDFTEMLKKIKAGKND